jgi:hypothetical protein
MAQGPGFLSTILDRTGARLKERLDMEKQFRDTQSQNIIQSIQAIDENGNPRLSPEQMEQAYDELTRLNSSKGAKDIIGKARQVFDMIHQ